MATISYCDCCNKILKESNHIEYLPLPDGTGFYPKFKVDNRHLAVLILKDKPMDICYPCYLLELIEYVKNIHPDYLDDGFQDYIEIKESLGKPKDAQQQ